MATSEEGKAAHCVLTPGAPACPQVSRVSPQSRAFAVFTVASLFVLSFFTGSTETSQLPWLLNPLGLSATSLVLCFIVSTVAREGLSRLLLFALHHPRFELERIDPPTDKVARLKALEDGDNFFLALNTVVEFVGFCHAAAVISNFGTFPLKSFNLGNGPVAFWLALAANDVGLWCFYKLAHRDELFPLLLAQHRRQGLPSRGYLDAANQHPLEQAWRYLSLSVSLLASSRAWGLHAGAGWTIVLAWTLVDLIHHMPFNVEVHLPMLYPSFAREHQMHHRHRRCNFGMSSTLVDRLFGSYKEFRELNVPEPEPKKPLMWYEKSVDPDAPAKEEASWLNQVGRPAMLPSGKAHAGLAFALVVVTLTLEMYELGGGLPVWHEMMRFAKPLIVLTNMGLVCLAIEKACSKEPDRNSVRLKKLMHRKADESRVDRPDRREATRGMGAIRRVDQAVPAGHFKQFVGDKDYWKPNMQSVEAKSMRESKKGM